MIVAHEEPSAHQKCERSTSASLQSRFSQVAINGINRNRFSQVAINGINRNRFSQVAINGIQSACSSPTTVVTDVGSVFGSSFRVSRRSAHQFRGRCTGRWPAGRMAGAEGWEAEAAEAAGWVVSEAAAAWAVADAAKEVAVALAAAVAERAPTAAGAAAAEAWGAAAAEDLAAGLAVAACSPATSSRNRAHRRASDGRESAGGLACSASTPPRCAPSAARRARPWPLHAPSP